LLQYSARCSGMILCVCCSAIPGSAYYYQRLISHHPECGKRSGRRLPSLRLPVTPPLQTCPQPGTCFESHITRNDASPHTTNHNNHIAQRYPTSRTKHLPRWPRTPDCNPFVYLSTVEITTEWRCFKRCDKARHDGGLFAGDAHNSDNLDPLPITHAGLYF
jgi:hypothetical protein